MKLKADDEKPPIVIPQQRGGMAALIKTISRCNIDWRGREGGGKQPNY